MPIDDLLEKVNPALINPKPAESDKPAEEPDPVVEDAREPDEAEDEPVEVEEGEKGEAGEAPETEPAPEVVAEVVPATPAPPAAPITTTPVETKPAARAPAPDAYAEKLKKYKGLAAEIQGMKAEGTFDAYEQADKIVELQLLGSELFTDLAEQQVAQREAATYWTDWGKQHPKVGNDRGRKIFEEEIQNAAARGYTGDSIQIRASEAFESRVKQIEAQKKLPTADAPTPVRSAAPVAPAKTVKPVAPVTQGGGRVTPPGNPARPPAIPKTPEERLKARVSPQMVRDFLQR